MLNIWMFSSPLSHFSSIILLQVASYYQGSTIMTMMSMWYVILVPFFILMVVVGSSHWNNHDSDEEIKVDNRYQGEEETQNKSKRSKVECESAQRMFIGRSASPHASAFSPSSSGRKTLSYFLDEGCRDDVDANFFRFFYACGIPFNVLRSPYWHEML